ncbi:hypothetical protein WA026_000135 [Henosepilachna vigintioctopunctata]|uniref:Uncharacterized protein n=1 Tax=Henosepilachna vigintioctopunctata TaxID=420089 RepID=A0AAW1V2W4_9CUCU
MKSILLLAVCKRNLEAILEEKLLIMNSTIHKNIIFILAFVLIKLLLISVGNKERVILYYVKYSKWKKCKQMLKGYEFITLVHKNDRCLKVALKNLKYINKMQKCSGPE